MCTCYDVHEAYKRSKLVIQSIVVITFLLLNVNGSSCIACNGGFSLFFLPMPRFDCSYSRHTENSSC